MGDTRGRLRALDGLRGIAALVVLFSHVVDGGWRPVSEWVMRGGTPRGGLARAFVSTPLATLWAGPQFVIVFFVLSGFVLTRALERRRTSPGAFYAGRIVRLYLPTWLAFIPAALLLLLVARAPHGGGGAGYWLDAYAHLPSFTQVLRDLSLISAQAGSEQTGTLNGVLWSLRWEVIFSALLPLVLLARPILRRSALPVALLMVLAVQRGPLVWMIFLPPFILGTLLALHEDTVARWSDRLGGRGLPLAVGAVAALLSADVWLPGQTRAHGAGGALVVGAATGAVLLPMMYASVRRRLEGRVPQWLGSRSFSLYLLHHPIVLAYAYAFRPPFLVLLACVLPTALLAAELFHRAVERPAHRLSRVATLRVEQRRAHRRALSPALA